MRGNTLLVTGLVFAIAGAAAARAQEGDPSQAAEVAAAKAADASEAEATPADASKAAEAGTAAEATPEQDLQALIRQADALYARREVGPEGPRIAQMQTLLEEAVKKHPKSYELRWRLARVYLWRSDGYTKEKPKSRFGRMAMDTGDAARALSPKRVEGHYYAALGAGTWSQGMGILSALAKGIEGKFNERLDKAIALNPDFDCGGPLVSKGRYFYELPWPKYDDEKAVEWLERTLKTCPDRVRAWVYLAEVHHKEDRDEKAREALDKALSIDAAATYDPIESRRMQRYGKKLRESWR